MRIPIALYLLALLARLAALIHFPDAAYPDAYYYSDVARNVAASRGLTVDFIWIFAEVGGRIPADPVLPIPSNAHWMPLASLVQVPFIALLGSNPIAAALPFAIIGSVAAPLTWAIARDAGASRRVAVGAGILVALPALLLVFMVQPDNFSLYQPLVAGALWLGARGLRGDARGFALAGLLVGFATLSRNDGVFVGATLGLIFAWDRWRAWKSRGERLPRIPLWAAVGCLALFSAVVAPWIVRQLTVFGQISPSSASGKVFFIRSIDEWNSITTPATLDWLLGQGIGPFLGSRVGGLVAAVGIFSTLALAGLLVVPLVVGVWARRRSIDFQPLFVYAALLFGFSGLVSSVHVPGGTFIHSAVALVPHAYILVLEGVAVGIAWISARRPKWNREAATRVFTGAAVAFGAIAAVVVTFGVHGSWDAKLTQRRAIAAALEAAGATRDARVMAIDAAGINYVSGRGGVVTPNDPIDTIEKVARAYRIEWLVLERDGIVPALAPVLLNEGRPDWIGPAVYTLRTADGSTPVAALYPICQGEADVRCDVVAAMDLHE